MKDKLRVLVILHPSLIPPDDVTGIDIENSAWRTEYYVITTLRQSGHNVKVLGVESDLKVILKAKEEFNPHIAYNLLEQFDGEAIFDNNVVAYLELLKLPYTGCNSKGLLLARDKALSKKILQYHRIKTPQFEVAKKGKKFKRNRHLKFPLIVKSLVDEGSLGISQNSIVGDDEKLHERIRFIHESIDSDAIIESYIPGSDIYVSVLGNSKLEVFPILELKFKNAPDSVHTIATSKVKWSPEYRKKYDIDVEIMDNLSTVACRKIQRLCRRIYKALCLSGYARLDLRMTENGELFFIEANPNPEIARIEDFAFSAKKAGHSYPALLDKILSLGLRWNPTQWH